MTSFGQGKGRKVGGTERKGGKIGITDQDLDPPEESAQEEAGLM